VQAPVGEVDVRPLQAEYLVAAHPAHRGQPQEREQPVADCGTHELAQLLFGQRDVLDPPEGTLLWGSGDDGDVAGDQSAP
jgi:hypothetical protein